MAGGVNGAVEEANQEAGANEPVEDNQETCPIELILTVRRTKEWPKNPEATLKDAKEGGTVGDFDLKKTGQEAALVTGVMLEAAGPSSRTAGSDQRVVAGTYWMIRNPGSKGRYRLVQTTQAAATSTFGNRGLVNIHSGNQPTHLEGCLCPGSKWVEKGEAAPDLYPFVEASRAKMTELQNAISAHAKTDTRKSYDGANEYNTTFYCNVLVVIHEIAAAQ